MDTTESNYFDQAQDIIGFSPKNNLLFYNKYNGYTYDAYGNINLLLTNSGMLAVYHIKEKQKQVIGDLTTETNRLCDDFCDMVVGIKDDFSKFYIFEDANRNFGEHWINESGQTITNIDGVWEIDISSLGLKDE